MVLLTIVTTSNPHTLYFDHLIEKPSYIRLLSTSLCNSWHNLKNRGGITFYDKHNNSQTAPPSTGLLYFRNLSPNNRKHAQSV